LKTVFFDVGNTLLFPDRSRILASLYERNRVPTLEHWQAVERACKRKFDAFENDGRRDHGFWYMFYDQLLQELGIKDKTVHDALVEATRISANWGEMRPGTRDVLLRLGQRYSLGVISNADGKIVEVLTHCGIHDCFASITDSGVIGCEKPHPLIFESAMRAMKASLEESLYVGDVYSVDYLGATRAGMQAILFDVCGAYRGTELPRVESLEQLEASLCELKAR
jgi:HAD superfamily hydrolase (TIGR01549 family)